MLTAADIMSTTFHSLSPATTIAEAAQIFTTASASSGRRIFGMMVIDDNSQLVGILSMYDILLFFQPKHAQIWSEMGDIDISGLLESICSQSKEILVGDIMSTQVTTVSKDTHIFGVLEIMNKQHIRRIPVIEENSVVGIVYISDLFFHLAEKLS